jgi:hypothetical protein
MSLQPDEELVGAIYLLKGISVEVASKVLMVLLGGHLEIGSVMQS